ncbi:MAG TPA: hypothetical protein VK589_03035 [Chryseolinea sp.]|nr:hypothetical protein [Chryseolinea sp.]
MIVHAKDLSEQEQHDSHLQRSFPVDPSRPGTKTLISFAKPIPLAQVFDKGIVALEDSPKEEDLNAKDPSKD